MSQSTLDLNAFQDAWQLVDADDAPFCKRHIEEVRETRPYEGWSILHNIPLSVETVCKLEPLVLGGADVTVTSTRFLIPATFNEAVELLNKIGIRYVPDQKIDREYDFYLDCSGELAKAPPPRKGIIELTQTGSQIYRSQVNSVPVLSVDDSRLKGLETFFGTGDGFRRAFTQLTGETLCSHHFFVFGYGRVGRGVAYPILQSGSPVTIVDCEPAAVERAKSDGCDAYLLSERSAWEEALEEASAVVTTTGVISAMTKLFSDVSMFRGKILSNMGAEDEYGELFVNMDVLNDRLPINFALRHPTAMRYFDPIIYAHNRGIEWIGDRELIPGYHPLPADISGSVLQEWEKTFCEDIDLL